MKKKIGLISYYGGIERILGGDASDGSRDFGNRRWVEALSHLKEAGYDVCEYFFHEHDRYDIVLFLDMPRVHHVFILCILNIFFKRIKSILILEETPLARSRLLCLFPGLFSHIHINSEFSYKFTHYPTTTFSLASLPEVSEIVSNSSKILSSERSILLSSVCSHKLAIGKNQTYSFRYYLIRSLLKTYPNKFRQYGFGWQSSKIPFNFPLIQIVRRVKFIDSILRAYYGLIYPPVPNTFPTKSKVNILRDSTFSLCFEPYTGKPISVLEKIFEPLLYGSIPIYVNTSGYCPLPEGIVLIFSSLDDYHALINQLEGVESEELRRYRQAIFEYLISSQADRYRFSRFSKGLLDLVESYVGQPAY